MLLYYVRSAVHFSCYLLHGCYSPPPRRRPNVEWCFDSGPLTLASSLPSPQEFPSHLSFLMNPHPTSSPHGFAPPQGEAALSVLTYTRKSVHNKGRQAGARAPGPLARCTRKIRLHYYIAWLLAAPLLIGHLTPPAAAVAAAAAAGRRHAPVPAAPAPAAGAARRAGPWPGSAP